VEKSNTEIDYEEKLNKETILKNDNKIVANYSNLLSVIENNREELDKLSDFYSNSGDLVSLLDLKSENDDYSQNEIIELDDFDDLYKIKEKYVNTNKNYSIENNFESNNLEYDYDSIEQIHNVIDDRFSGLINPIQLKLEKTIFGKLPEIGLSKLTESNLGDRFKNLAFKNINKKSIIKQNIKSENTDSVSKYDNLIILAKNIYNKN
jgi:hypothetical protein